MTILERGTTPGDGTSPGDNVDTRFGPLIAAARTAFGTDLTYAATMASRGATIEYRQALWAARQEASQEGVPRNQITARAEQLLGDRGIVKPPAAHRN